jgi:hypothetical protein
LAKIEGFARVLADVLMRNQHTWASQSTTELIENAVITLASLPSGEADYVGTAWGWLEGVACRQKKWEPVRLNTGRALAILLERSADGDRINSLLESAGASLPRQSGGGIDNSDKALREWVRNMRPMLEALSARRSPKLTVIGSTRTYISLLNAVMSECQTGAQQIASRITTGAAVEIPRALGEDARQLPTDEHFFVLVHSLAAHHTGLGWRPFLEAIKENPAECREGYGNAPQTLRCPSLASWPQRLGFFGFCSMAVYSWPSMVNFTIRKRRPLVRRTGTACPQPRSRRRSSFG